MTTLLSLRSDIARRRWMFSGGLILGLAAITLLARYLFGPRSYLNAFSLAALLLVLSVLASATFLHARFLLLARREHFRTASVLDATEREFQSIFDSALDAFLILDDLGCCIEANPAALDLLGVGRTQLVGCPVQKFLSSAEDFEHTWKQFLARKQERREMQLVRWNGDTIFVECSAKADYLPGRHVAILRDVSQRRQTEAALRESDERFRQMADNIEEIFWMLDAETREVVYVNPAFEQVTGRSCQSLRENPMSYQELFHPEDRVRILTRLEEAVRTGQFDEEFRLLRPDRTIRWVLVRGFPVPDAAGAPRRLVGTAQDITARKSAEEQMARHLSLAESARAEADAFRKITLALTENLSMNNVLDTLLQSLVNLIPCESARVVLREDQSRFFLARELECYQSTRRPQKCPFTWNATESRFFMQVLNSRTSLMISNTTREPDWTTFKGHSQFHSWLCVPLIASQNVLGLLALGDRCVNAFSQEHLRLAKSLAIPAAVAIQNARLYERAEIYAAELEERLGDS